MSAATPADPAVLERKALAAYRSLAAQCERADVLRRNVLVRDGVELHDMAEALHAALVAKRDATLREYHRLHRLVVERIEAEVQREIEAGLR